jgi:catalase
VNYEPNSFAPEAAREVPQRGFRSFEAEDGSGKLRVRAPLFADHFTQARMFFLSQTDVERDHIAAALIFELSKVETPAIRARVVSQLLNIDDDLGARVSAGLGLSGVAPAKPAMERKDMDPSPALSILKKAKPTLKGRTVGLMVSDGADAGLVNALRKAAQSAGANVKVMAEAIAGAELSDGKVLTADQRIEGGPSSLFDAVAIVASEEGAARLAGKGAAQDFVKDAYAHLKTIAFTDNLTELFAKAGLRKTDLDEACIALAKRADAERFVDTAAKGKLWSREPKVRPLP